MKAKDIMTKNIFSIHPSTTIKDAMQMLVDNAISGVPVLDENESIIGIITEKDLIVAFDFLKKADEPVESFMSKEVQGVSENASIEEISKILVQKNIKRVPVLNGDKIIGIISRRDVLKHVLSIGS